MDHDYNFRFRGRRRTRGQKHTFFPYLASPTFPGCSLPRIEGPFSVQQLIRKAQMEEELPDENGSDSPAPLLEIGDQPSREFLELFTKLDPNLAGEFIERAWKQYDTVGQQVVLEGNPSVWMACAFFTSVWQATPVGQQQQQELACRFSLTKLLQLCGCSVLDYFDKLTKWGDMVLASRRLLDFIGRVQANLAVSAVIFKKLLPIFRHLFVFLPPAPQTRQSPHKTRFSGMLAAQRVSSGQLLELIWLFYIAMRKQLPHGKEDLMNSFHLLLSVLDQVYCALQNAGFERHLNPAFVRSLAASEQSPLELLCEQFEAVTLDAKHLRVHWMVPRLQVLCGEGVLGDIEGAALIEDLRVSRQAFDELYENRMLVRAEVDERLFLRAPLAHMEALFAGQLDESALSILREFGDQGELIDTELLMKISTQSCLERLGAQKQPVQTPIAGKSYVITPETVCPNITLSAELGPAERLAQMLEESREETESILDYIYEECQQSPRDHVAEQLLSFTRKFLNKVDEEAAERGAEFDEKFEASMAKHVANMESLFHYFIQKVITYDRERAMVMGLEMNLDLGTILQNGDFLASVFICACDLTLWANDSRRHFPWAAELLRASVAPTNFYRIFELIVRAETGLTREMVKHLNAAEECVLDELAWAPDSPIWAALQQSRAMELGESSPVPGSHILARSLLQAHRHADLPQATIMFFKKVYHLAAIRLADLCERVRIVDELTRQKIWTLFEHIFRMQIDLLKGRHLDQLLMCSVYIVSKVCGLSITFQHILSHYRHQPQASPRVYRQVLMERPPFEGDGPGTSAAAAELEQSGRRADLIKFYNQVFVAHIQDFVKLLHPSGTDAKENLVPLTPMPKVPLNPLSPRKLVSDRINVMPMSQYAQSLSLNSRFSTSTTAHRYDFHKSPSKDLKNINAMVRAGNGPSGRGGGESSTATGMPSYYQHTSGGSSFY